VSTGFIWLKVEVNGGACEHDDELPCFIKEENFLTIRASISSRWDELVKVKSKVK
jgi:hypothetical protein